MALPKGVGERITAGGLMLSWFARFSVMSIGILCALAQEPKDCQPPGRLVDIGGYRLHIHCTGERGNGKPTVVLLHGLGDFSIDWALVQPEVARFTRVCSYDPRGVGWSDPEPLRWGQRKAAEELHTLLRNAHEESQFVLVGHSWGGLTARIYTSLYPTDVKGMVLVDSTHEDAYWEINDNIVVPRLLSDGDWARIKPRGQSEHHPSPPEEKLTPPFDRLPPEAQKLRRCAKTLPHLASATVGSDVADLRRDLIEVYSETRGSQGEYKGLRDMPLIVISRRLSEAGPIPQGKQEHNKQVFIGLAHASRRGKYIAAESADHHIQMTQPELVVISIREVVTTGAAVNQLGR